MASPENPVKTGTNKPPDEALIYDLASITFKVDVDELSEQLKILDALNKVEPESNINCNCGYSASKNNSLFVHLHKPVVTLAVSHSQE